MPSPLLCLVRLPAGFAAAGIEPGPKFLRKHATACRRVLPSLAPAQLRQLSQAYARFGYQPSGQLGETVREAVAAAVAAPPQRSAALQG